MGRCAFARAVSGDGDIIVDTWVCEVSLALDFRIERIRLRSARGVFF